MEKTSLLDLKKKLFLRSALIPIDNLEEILSLNDTFTCDEILYELFTKAKQEFEYYEPLITEFQINPNLMISCNCPPGAIELTDNFDLYLKCMLPENQIHLIPNAAPMLRVGMESTGYNSLMSYYGTYSGVAGNYTYPNDYQRPYLFIGNLLPSTTLWMRGIYNRPMDPAWKKDKTFGKKAALYYLDINQGVRGQMFIDQCMIELLNYIRSLKANFSLPNFPIDIFGSVDTLYQELKGSLDNRYLQSGTRGELLV